MLERKTARSLVIMVFLTMISVSLIAQTNTTPPDPISEKTANLEKLPGFFPLYWDESTGKLFLEIDKWDHEFLFMVSLPAGIGSNDIGLDRGQLGSRQIVKFQRMGPKVLLLQPNYDFRAESHNAMERQAVREAFAQSVLWGFTVEAEADGRVLVDASAFFLRDGHNITGRLQRGKQGNYKLDASRSAFYLPRTKNFPKNTEVEVMLTFTGSNPGNFVRSVVPTPQAITVRERYSFIELPDDNYQPRRMDYRSGFFGISYFDYSAHIHEPIRQQFIARHRLEKKDPTAAVSEAVEPIVYYLDSGTPEPVRSALLDGARWWNQAFEAIGYRDAFQVKMLPEGADPMDVRYNVIQWVHRSTRGWSYGDAVIDPRTGEIIKGHVTLGSLRVRQDYLIAEGLLAPYGGDGPPSAEMQAMALARLRQLSAHEIGHTIGITHNFHASTVDRASVMDYPHPYVKIGPGNTLDLSDAYATDIGEWDKISVAFGYQDFPDGTDEAAALEAIIQDGIKRGLILISDQDARPAGGAHPKAHLWDNGENAAIELERVLKVREIALNNFSENNIQNGAPMASLEEVLVPMYFFHRYQLEAAVKLIGGLSYTYAMRGDGQQVTEIVPDHIQEKALEVLLKTLDPKVLAVPENILEIIPPRPFGMSRSREVVNLRTSLTFDPVAAAETAANLTLGLLLHPARAARLIEYHARDKDFPGFDDILDELIGKTIRKRAGDNYHGEIQRAVNSAVVYQLMNLVNHPNASPQAKAIAFAKLKFLGSPQGPLFAPSDSQWAHGIYLSAQIEKFIRNPEDVSIPEPLNAPAGSPIGGGGDFCSW